LEVATKFGQLGWRSPVRGPVHPSYVPLFDPSGFGWLEGFDELLCRCGLTSNGAPDFDRRGALLYPLHGRIANLPAENVRTVHDPDTGAVSLTGVVYETRFHHQKLRLTSTLTMTPGAAAFSVHDEISNLSDAPATAQLLYHFNLGLPLLDPGARVVAPVRNLTPRNERAAAGLAHWDICGAPDASYTEQVYFMDLHADEDGKTMALLKNATGDRGASVHFDTRQLPFLILWKNTCAVADGYVVGLEPGTNFPNPRSFEEEHGRFIRLAAGESASFDVRFAFHGSPPEITGIESQIERLRTQGKANPAAAATTGWTMR